MDFSRCGNPQTRIIIIIYTFHQVVAVTCAFFILSRRPRKECLHHEIPTNVLVIKIEDLRLAGNSRRSSSPLAVPPDTYNLVTPDRVRYIRTRYRRLVSGINRVATVYVFVVIVRYYT